MNIAYLTTEAVPFAKTGGLADVCGTLPREVANLGHRCAVILPAFRQVYRAGIEIESTDISFAIPMSRTKLVGGRLLRSKLPSCEVPVWLIDQPQYFDRDGLYGDQHGDYPDNAERFTFFCRAALAALTRIEMEVDLIHCNDWQTGLVPGLVRATPAQYAPLANAATVMTIHNMAYQGSFPADAFRWTGLDWQFFHHDSFEFYDQLNFLKAGITTADEVTTVSPRYAAEICTPEQGCGLDRVLAERRRSVVGIANGIDIDEWNPKTDVKLPARFDADSWQDGKAFNKDSLQSEFGLGTSRDTPLIGLVGRLAEQKGWDLILPVIERHVIERRPTQWMILGSGDARIEQELKRLHDQAPDQVAIHLGFHDALAHRIEAASDVFLMPSHYEPCGLNQLYSLRYGALPIVTATGGLADTVIDCTPETLADGTATGFHLGEVSVDGLDQAIGRAL
ncbi:MAG: glycogen synthase GlgA, partial [Planctomycetota bacterium]